MAVVRHAEHRIRRDGDRVVDHVDVEAEERRFQDEDLLARAADLHLSARRKPAMFAAKAYRPEQWLQPGGAGRPA
ncbi:hypothetical protein LNKW23_43750 [Paralimibaculum aggregatum]|uniref:Uncharacterized protein n=1 Tax=Paralimibaculum aggregatum TaxID=3036245 RepID=A0ABQ6LSW3_9RHOB|nr:hypothetical protein [Limibaculum sp. NKW23]GMG85159.1 hypothetical protein LNKW23_43750 [Limibaculum sp. NKW23]